MGNIRQFETGATRDTDQGKIDPEGYLSPLVIQRFSEYMRDHQVQPDGSLRASDNWQAGMPLEAYIKSAWRHFLDWWHCHRETAQGREGVEEALCALIFNASGYLHETVKARLAKQARSFFSAAVFDEKDFATGPGKIVPRYCEEWTEEQVQEAWPEPKAGSRWTVPSDQPGKVIAHLGEAGTWEMGESDYKSRDSAGIWDDEARTAVALDHMIQSGWARAVSS